MDHVELAPEWSGGVLVCPDLAVGDWFVAELQAFRTRPGDGARQAFVAWNDHSGEPRAGWVEFDQIRGAEALSA